MGWVVYGFRWLPYAWRSLRRRFRQPAPWAAFLIEAPPPELRPPPAPRWRRALGIGRAPMSLQELRGHLDQVCADPAVKGVVFHLRPTEMTGAQVESLRDLIGSVREAGKQVAAWATSYTATTYAVACAAEQVLMQPGGSVAPLGVARQFAFLAEALGRIGVRADFVQISPYKSAPDTFMRTGFSPESREMASWLADAAFGELVAAVAAGRRCDDDAARRLIDASPFTDRQALEARAVDALCAEEELTAKLEGRFQHWSEIRKRLRPLPPRRPGRAVGLIRVEGLILDGRSRRPPAAPPFPLPIIGSEQSGDLTVVRQARQLAASRRVGAVVLWIDSGGGSATASEAMTAALRDLAGRKPLVVAMGSLAASGGYYVATPAARVFAQPSTLTGSIGVFGGKLATGDLLRRLLVNTETVARGEHVAMFGPERPFSPDEREWVRQSIARTYELFLERVGGGRGRPAAEIEPVAGGRVWTGRQALEHGLVDQLGGFQEALTEARRRGGLRADAPVIEVAGGRGEVSPLTGAAGLLEHAGAALEGLNRAPAWTLLPWWFREG